MDLEITAVDDVVRGDHQLGELGVLVLAGLAKSKGEARRTVAEGGAYLNNMRVEDLELRPTDADLVAGSWLVLRRGKKNFAGVEVVTAL